MNMNSRNPVRRLARLLAAGACAGLAVLVPVRAEDTVCAKVVLEIQQELTLERDAFDAMMRIHNLVPVALENVDIDVHFTDANGLPVESTANSRETNALFFVRVASKTGVDGLDGEGQVAANTVAEIHWLIIPAPGAGGSDPAGKMYFAGATLRYRMDGEAREMDVTPDFITVKPMPLLRLDYFIPDQVYGDDAFTDAIEAPVPFDLGLRIVNAGFGTARKLKITSAQPRIVDNQQGLLIGFQITGTELNDVPVQPARMDVDFGTLPPGDADVAAWIMECTLSGRFIEFAAMFSHADELGGELTSLIDAVNTHILLGKVLADNPGNDKLEDFLVAETNGTCGLYESTGADTLPVLNLSTSAVIQADFSSEPVFYTITVPPTAQPFLVRTELPTAENWTVLAAVRSDGKVIKPQNAWVQRRREKQQVEWHEFLNLFEADGGGTYTIALARNTAPMEENEAPVLQYIGRKVGQVGQQLGFVVSASDPNRTYPTLKAYPLPAGATFTTNANGTAYFNWTPQAGQEGVYPVIFSASDGLLFDWEIVRIYVGQASEPLTPEGLPESLADWRVEITRIAAAPSSGNATVMWAAVTGLYYDVYYSDEKPGQNMIWRKMQTVLADRPQEEDIQDASLTAARKQRFYQVTLGGEPVSSNRIWGLIRKSIPAGYTMIAPPLRSDRRFDGDMGWELAQELDGNDGGLGSGADEVYVLQPNGTWRMLYLDDAGTWRESDGLPSTYELPPGQGIWVARKTPAATEFTFTGEVGNDGTRTVTLQPGFNLIGLSEGKDLPLAQALAGADPVGGPIEELADQLVLQNPNGSWRFLMYVEGWGPAFDGQWFDLSTYQVVPTNEVLPPGTAYYYLRRGAATDLEF